MRTDTIAIGIVSLCLGLAASGCSVMEQSMDDVKERPLPTNPSMATLNDSTRVLRAKSAIQRSSEYLLSSYVFYKNGEYVLDISEKEREELGISDKEYDFFKKKISHLNSSRRK